MSGPRARRAERGASRRRQRRRGVLGWFGRGLFWLLVLAGVFVLGVGFGKSVGGSSANSRNATITRDRGAVTATMPTKTVVETTTVVKIKRAPRKRG